MRCFDPLCVNKSTDTYCKRKGITFHLLPTDPNVRTKWLDAIGYPEDLENIPLDQFYVCSEHFYIDDLCETNTLLPKTKIVPVKVCRICLTTELNNSKLISLKSYKLDNIFYNLTGVVMTKNEKLPQSVCTECAHRLTTFNKFRKKSMKSNSIMIKLLCENQALTLKSILNINRRRYQLESNLSYKHYTPDHFDALVIENDISDDEHELVLEDKTISEVKNEDQSAEYMDIAKEEYEENVIVTNNDIFVENDTNSDNEIVDNGNFINNEMTSDDEFVINDMNSDYEVLENDNFINNDTMSDNEMISDTEIKSENDSVKYDYCIEVITSNDDFSSDDNRPIGSLNDEDKVGKRKKNAPKRKKGRKKNSMILCGDIKEKDFTMSEILSFQEQVAEMRKRIDSSNYKNARFKCNYCYRGFLDKAAFTSHMLRHTDVSGLYACAVCKLHFNHRRWVRRHVFMQHSQRFRCRECPDFNTTHRQFAISHERWHKGTKYKCQDCGEVFDKSTSYLSHKRMKHPSDFICTLCGFSYVSERGLQVHNYLKHRFDNVQVPEDGPLCEPCGLRFLSQEAYHQHLQVSAKHDAETARTKNDPVYMSKKKKGVVRRRRIARDGSPPKPIICEECGVQLRNLLHYAHHFRVRHPDKNRTQRPESKTPYMCEQCGKIFFSMARLTEHNLVHTGEKPYKCQHCDKGFTQKANLRSHEQVHRQVRDSYECPICGKHFTRYDNRRRHMFIHTGLKPFKCDICAKCFGTMGEKRLHMDHVHLNKPWPKRVRLRNGKRLTLRREGAGGERERCDEETGEA